LLALIANDFLGLDLSTESLHLASVCPHSLSQCPDFSPKIFEDSLWKATCNWAPTDQKEQNQVSVTAQTCSAMPIVKGSAVRVEKIWPGQKVMLVTSNGNSLYLEGDIARTRCACKGAYQEFQVTKPGDSDPLANGDTIYLSADSKTWMNRHTFWRQIGTPRRLVPTWFKGGHRAFIRKGKSRPPKLSQSNNLVPMARAPSSMPAPK